MSLTLTRRYNVDRFGYLIPTKYGSLPMAGAVATYRPGEGRFGGAVAVEEGTTNLWTNPGWLDGTLFGWGNVSRDGATGIREVVRDARFGYALRLAKTDSGNGRWGVYQNKTWHQTGSVIADSVYVKVISASNGARLQYYSDYSNSGGSSYYGRGWSLNLNTFGLSQNQGTARHLTITPVGDGWYRIEFVTAEGDIVGGMSYYWIDRAPAEILLAYPQKEAKPFATSFVDGSRAKGALHYDGNQLSLGANEGTFSMWMYVNVSIPRGGEYPTYPQQCWLEFESGSLWCRSYTPTQFDLMASTDDNRHTSIGGNITNTGWHLWTAIWSDGEASIYIDGSKVGSKVLGDYAPSGRLSKLYVGCGRNNPAVPGSLFDEPLILPYAASEGEIVSWYEAQGPLPPHPQALLQWDRQAVRPAQMVKL